MRKVLRGNVIKTSCVFTDDGGGYVTPGSVSCKYKLDGSSAISVSPTLVATGRYLANIDTESLAAGFYTIQWKGDGSSDSLEELRLEIVEPEIAL